METASKQLILENISKHFGSLVAVQNVDLVIEPGEFICFLGPSGCGKTTLLRIITGFEQQTSGDVIYDGNVINEVIPQKRDFGIVFQSYALFPNMTVHQNIAFGLKMRKMPPKLIDDRVSEILQLVGLSEWERHYPSQLSGGQQQRVALARALASLHLLAPRAADRLPALRAVLPGDGSSAASAWAAAAAPGRLVSARPGGHRNPVRRSGPAWLGIP